MRGGFLGAFYPTFLQIILDLQHVDHLSLYMLYVGFRDAFYLQFWRRDSLRPLLWVLSGSCKLFRLFNINFHQN